MVLAQIAQASPRANLPNGTLSPIVEASDGTICTSAVSNLPSQPSFEWMTQKADFFL